MNEIFNTLKDKFPFLSLIRKGDLEYVGIVQNEDVNVISFYDYGRLMMPQDKMHFLKCGEIWWHESKHIPQGRFPILPYNTDHIEFKGCGDSAWPNCKTF
jgi:hypothetical protein